MPTVPSIANARYGFCPFLDILGAQASVVCIKGVLIVVKFVKKIVKNELVFCVFFEN